MAAAKAFASAKTAKASKVPDAAKATTKAKAHTGARRSDLLDQDPKRKRVASPVSAPLTYRKPEEAAAKDEAKRGEAKLAKRAQEDAMWADYHADPSDAHRNTLWVYYQSLVRYIGERLKSKLPECVDVGDLVSSGNIGLQDAISKFDPQVGVRFETYCVPRIRGAMLDSIRAIDWVPRLIRNKNHQYERLVRELAAKLGREPSEEEIAKRLKMSMEKLRKLRKELDVKAQISIEGGHSDNADERDLLRLEMLEDRTEVEPTRELQREEIREMALRGLHPNEKHVVERYYFEGQSMKQIGAELNLSESRICQIHAQVLDVLRKKFRAYAHSCSF